MATVVLFQGMMAFLLVKLFVHAKQSSALTSNWVPGCGGRSVCTRFSTHAELVATSRRRWLLVKRGRRIKPGYADFTTRRNTLFDWFNFTVRILIRVGLRFFALPVKSTQTTK